MHLIICLSATINNIPEKVEKNLYFVDNNNLPEQSKTTASNVKGNYKDGGKVYLYCFKPFFSLLTAYELICHIMNNINFKCC